MNIHDALTMAARELDAASIDSARADARILLRHVLQMTLEQLLLAGEREMNEGEHKAFEALVVQRAQRKPIAQVIGSREFWGLPFKVTGDTLDPRPDSETLIQCLLGHLPERAKPLRMLDLGTGTGCLLLAALSEYPAATGLGVDKSEAALAVARDNAATVGLKNRAEFVKSDWNSELNGVWDVVISNPPYIPTEVIPTLAPEVAQHEPITALDGGSDGLDCYRAISRFLPMLLAEGGVALLEVGAGQAKDVAGLFAAQGMKIAEIARDLAGIERCVVITH